MTVDDAAPPMIWSSTIDSRAHETPDKTFCEILETDWREKGSREITYGQFSRAVNKLCWWFEENFGPSKDFDTFAYVGDNDLRYSILMIAAQKSERKMVITELNRLTHPALLLYLENEQCLRWVGGSEAQTALGKSLPDERPGTKLSTLPPLDYWLDDGDVPEYPFHKTWEEVKMNVPLVIHSSGTTGTPKPLPYTLEGMAAANHTYRHPDKTIDNPNNIFAPLFDTRMLWTAPPQWLAGIMGYLLVPLFWEGVTILPPVFAGVPTPSSVVAELLEKFQPEGGFFVPSTLRDLCSEPKSLELLKKMKFIIYAGAPLDEWVGDLLCTELHLVVVIGSTETNAWPLWTLEDPKDWRYYWIDERLGHRLEHFHDDLYEIVIDKKPEYRRYQGVFLMFPEKDTWHTQDLYTPHPTKPGLLRYRGRKDDLVKLQWLTKVRAGDMESALTRHTKVEEAMVGGQGRPAPFVLVQLAPSDVGISEEELWKIVKDLNEEFSAEVHIPRENILRTDPSKPLKKLRKGTLDRRSILVDYEKDISSVYDKPNGVK